MKGTRNMKGFFFVLVSFILISYILVTTFMWVKAIETGEQTYSEALRASSLYMLTDQITAERMEFLGEVVGYHSFYALVNHSVEDPLQPGIPPDDEIYHIREAYFELMLTGTASGDHFESGADFVMSNEQAESATFTGFMAALNDSLARSGFELEEFWVDPETMQFNQTGHPLTYHLNYTLNVKIKDTQSGTSFQRPFPINQGINVTGFFDPGIARDSEMLELDGGIVYKPVFLYSDFVEVEPRDAEPLYPDQIETGDEGQGWFYGPVILATDEGAIAAVEAGNRSLYILAGNYSDIIAVPHHDTYGAYILTNEPGTSSGDCGTSQVSGTTFNAVDRYESSPGDCDVQIIGDYTNKPFVVAPDFMDDVYDELRGPRVIWPTETDSHRVLFISPHTANAVQSDPELKFDNVEIFDIEDLRDFVLCSYYFWTDYDEKPAPSYLQRLFSDWKSRESEDHGIETTVVGKWAGGVDTPDREAWDAYSRIGWEFFSEEDGINIKGMPGCKFVGMCIDGDSEVGHFKFRYGTEGSGEYYLGIEDEDEEGNIGCNNDEYASCETQ